MAADYDKVSRVNSQVSDVEQCKEYAVSLPWGIVAIKEWGPPDGIPVLGLHGWKDNAGTFDTLGPLLPSYIRLVCPDFAGHGLSSHYPKGMMYNFWDYVLHVKLLAEHFQWEKFTMIGHSLGGSVALMFTAIFPDMVDKLITLDNVKPRALPLKKQPEYVANALQAYETIFKKMDNESLPSYTYEKARQRIIEGSQQSLNKTAAEILMRRGLKQASKGGFCFSRDLRLVVFNLPVFDWEQQVEFLSRIKCPLLIIKAKQGPYYEPREVYERVMRDVYSKFCIKFRYIEVEGTHHVHLTNPHEVIQHISTFLTVQSNL